MKGDRRELILPSIVKPQTCIGQINHILDPNVSKGIINAYASNEQSASNPFPCVCLSLFAHLSLQVIPERLAHARYGKLPVEDAMMRISAKENQSMTVRVPCSRFGV